MARRRRRRQEVRKFSPLAPCSRANLRRVESVASPLFSLTQCLNFRLTGPSLPHPPLSPSLSLPLPLSLSLSLSASLSSVLIAAARYLPFCMQPDVYMIPARRLPQALFISSLRALRLLGDLKILPRGKEEERKASTRYLIILAEMISSRKCKPSPGGMRFFVSVLFVSDGYQAVEFALRL